MAYSIEHVLQRGIDVDRVMNHQDILEDLTCPICRSFLSHPKSCSSCQVVFCRSCIETWRITQPNSCPMRCSPFEIRPASPLIQTVLSRTKLRCRNETYGCSEILSYDNLEDHEGRICSYATKLCPNCSDYFLLNVFDEHHLSCNPPRIFCRCCQGWVNREEYNNGHIRRCLLSKFNQFIEQQIQTTLPIQNNTPLHRVLNQLENIPEPSNFVQILKTAVRLLVSLPTDEIIGIDHALEARDKPLIYLFYRNIQLILKNYHIFARYVLYSILFCIGYICASLFYTFSKLTVRMREHVISTSYVIIFFSAVIFFGLPPCLKAISDFSIISCCFLTSTLSCSFCRYYPLELLPVHFSLRITSFIFLLFLILAKFALIMLRIFIWCTPPYISAGVFAWSTIFTTYQMRL